MLSKTVELSIHQKGTENFINSDPTEIILKTLTEVWNAGSRSFNASVDRDSQTFKVIWSGSQDGIVLNGETRARSFDFILIGKYDAEIAIGDYWTLNDQHFQIEWLAPYNGYEVKAGGCSHGSKPTG